VRRFQLFSGLGGGARRFNRGRAQVGSSVVWLRCVGGVDIAAAAARDLYRLAGLPAMVLELFGREHYRDFPWS